MRAFLHHVGERLGLYLPLAVLVAGALAFASQYVKPLPPSTLTMAAGPKGGFYDLVRSATANALHARKSS